MKKKLKVFFFSTAFLDGLADVGYYMTREAFLKTGFFERVQLIQDADVLAISSGSALVFPSALTYGGKGRLMLKAIKKFKKNPKRLVLIGGNISKAPAPVELLADVVCVGHIFRFMPVFGELVGEWLSSGKDKKYLLEKVAEKIPNAFVPYVHRRKYDPANLKYSYIEGHPQIPYDHEVDWSQNKAFAVDEKAYAVLATVGCKRKCYFCQPGWVEKWDEEKDYQKILYYENTINKKMRGVGISWISDNLASWKLVHLVSTASSSATVQDLLRARHKSRIIRLGVEGFSERLRRLVNKPLSKKQLEEVIMTNRHRSFKLFHIDGLPFVKDDDLEEFVEFWGRNWGGQKGRLLFKFTYFNPVPLTPMGWMPFYNDSPFARNRDTYFLRIKKRGNMRHRFMSVNTPERGFMRALLCNTDGLLNVLMHSDPAFTKMYHDRTTPLEKVLAWCEKWGYYDMDYGYDVDETLPSEFVDSGISKEVLRKIARKLEPEITTRRERRFVERRSAPEDYKCLDEILTDEQRAFLE